MIDYRLPGEIASRKRAVPVPINDDLAAELTKAKLTAATPYLIEWAGEQVQSIMTGFNAATERAKLLDVTPHTLRHTAVTWMMQAGIPAWHVAGMAGMTTEMVEKTYGHHHPDYLRDAAEALSGCGQRVHA